MEDIDDMCSDCSPNCMPRFLTLRKRKRIFLFAAKAISEGEELL
jgi:hypothetical protein